MAAKKKAANSGQSPNNVSQSELIKALTDAGYKLEGFSRHGAELVVRLIPADLETDDGKIQALEICAALGLPAGCRRFAQLPQDLLLVSVALGKEAEKQGTSEKSEPEERND